MPELFTLGRVVATPDSLSEIERSGDNVLLLVLRHHSGDWGDLDAYDKRLNRLALKEGSRIFSAYTLKSGKRIYIITDAADDKGNREGTTVMMVNEY